MKEIEMTTQQLNLLAVVSAVACWSAFVATWLAAENYNERRAPAERTRSWFGTAVTPGVVIASTISFAVPAADWRSLTFYAPPVRILGLVILLAATALTIWARLALGLMWSGAPAVKEQHQLRTSGPYAMTRHPIYTGILGMLLGSLLVAGGGRWIVLFPVMLILFEVKIHIEERLMLAEFPDDYPRYRRLVPRLVPGLRVIGRHRGGQQVAASH
jgi:protein-S-isoprenylcysteine O-methyltransferase Ste14